MNRPFGRNDAVPAPIAGDDPGTSHWPLSVRLGLPLVGWAIAVALGTPFPGHDRLVDPIPASFAVLVIWFVTLGWRARPKPPVLPDADPGEAVAAAVPRYTLPERLVYAARNGAAVGALLWLGAPVMMIFIVAVFFVLALIAACSPTAALYFEAHASDGGDGDGGDGGGDGGGGGGGD
ncbi:MAG: hypothetical protein ACOYOH_27060 [Paracraurococcus sp.]